MEYGLTEGEGFLKRADTQVLKKRVRVWKNVDWSVAITLLAACGVLFYEALKLGAI